MNFKFTFVVTIEADDTDTFDSMLTELEDAVVNISNSYEGHVTLDEGVEVK